MNISTTKFGSISIEQADVLTFVDGLIGMEDCQRWVLLGDSENAALAWLQSLESPNDAQVLVIISNVGGALALNLKAPLVIHLAERVGRQIVARDDHAVQHRLQATSRRKTA